MNPEDMSSSVYNLVCTKCSNQLRFAQFDEFLQHAKTQHGSAVGLQDMAILPEETAWPTTQPQCEGQQGLSHGDCERSSCNMHSQMAPSPSCARSAVSSATYDLRQLPRKCLIEMSQLLGKCLCIWHKPSRRRMTRRDRFHAYQLLLRKLREYQPAAKFHDARSIVRQIIVGYLDEERGCNAATTAASNFTNTNTNTDTNNNNISSISSNSSSDVQLQPVKSRTMLEQLLFLSSANASDTKELDIDKFCAFCNTGFSSTAAIFTHMVQYHLPAKRSRSQSLPSATAATTITVGTCTSDALAAATAMRPGFVQQQQANALARSSVYSLRSKSQLSTTIFNSDYETDFGSEQSDRHCEWLMSGSHSGSERRRRDAPKRKRKRTTKKRSHTRRRLKHCRHAVATPAPRRSLNTIDSTGAAIAIATATATVQPSASAITSHACLKCKRSFKRLRYLSSHMLRMHPPTQCACCHITFTTADQLKQHLLQQHINEPACPICAGAIGQWRMPAHLAEHFPNHICADCLATFHDAKQYRHHRLYCRLRDRLRCWHCAETFLSIQALRQHAKDAHQEHQPFKCGQCECQYKFLAALVRHEHRHGHAHRSAQRA